MAPLAVNGVERRRERRRGGDRTQWQSQAVLRPGQPVVLINICSRAALIESARRLRPGAITEMQLAGSGARASVKGRLDRCYVSALEPLRYRGVLLFDHGLELGSDTIEALE